VPANASTQMQTDLSTWEGNVGQLGTQADNQAAVEAAMQGQLKQLGLAPFVKAAPTAAQVREEFAGMAWNALTPVFKALAPWTGVVSGSMQSSLQSLLGVQVYVYQGPACNQGDAFQNQIDRMLYNNGQPLTAGSGGLHGKKQRGRESFWRVHLLIDSRPLCFSFDFDGNKRSLAIAYPVLRIVARRVTPRMANSENKVVLAWS